MADDFGFSEFVSTPPVTVEPSPPVTVPTPTKDDFGFSEFAAPVSAPPRPGMLGKFMAEADKSPLVQPGSARTSQRSIPEINELAVASWPAFQERRFKEWTARREAEEAYHRGNGGEGGPAPLDIYSGEGPYTAPTFEQYRNALMLQHGLPETLPPRGFLSSMLEGLVGQSRMALGGLAEFSGNAGLVDGPVEVMRQREEAAQHFATPDLLDTVGGGLGGSLPALAALATTRGKSLPTFGAWAVPAEAGAISYGQGMTDPTLTPTQNLSSAIIEALGTKLGGAFEPGFTRPTKQLPIQITKEFGEESLVSGAQDVSEQALDPERTGDIDYERALKAAGVGGLVGSLASGSFSVPGVANEGYNYLKDFKFAREGSTSTEPQVFNVDETVEAPTKDVQDASEEYDNSLADQVDSEIPPPERAKTVSPDAETTAEATVDIKPELAQSDTKLDAAIVPGSSEQYDNSLADKVDSELPPPKLHPKAGLKGKLGFLSPKGIVAYNSLSDLERADPRMQSTIEHLKNNPDPGGDVGSIQRVRNAIRNQRIKPKVSRRQEMETRPEPKEAFDVGPAPVAEAAANTKQSPQAEAKPEAQETIDFSQSDPKGYEVVDAPVLPIPAAKPAEKQVVRGATKSREEEKKFFGEVDYGQKLKYQAPKNFKDAEVRVSKDSGKVKTKVSIDPKTNYGVMFHEPSGKALIVRRTDEKGRADPEGNEIRPTTENGHVTTVGGLEEVKTFLSVEDAARFIGRNFVAHKGAGKAVAGTQDTAIKDGDTDSEGESQDAATKDNETDLDDETDSEIDLDNESQDEKRLAELGRRSKDLTDEELDEAEAIEARIKERKSSKANTLKSVADSPLTPRARQDLAKDIKPDMTAKNVGILVRNTVEEELGREPTQQEVGKALNDLVANGVITKDQAIIPGTSVQANAIGPQMIAQVAKFAGVKAKKMLELVMGDLTSDQAANVTSNPAVKPGQYGYRARQIAKAMMRMTGNTGDGGAGFVDFAGRLNHLLQARTIAAMFPTFRPILRVVQKQIDRTRIAFQDSFHRLDSLRNTKGEQRKRVEAALITFHLKDIREADFDKPFVYTDRRGKPHSHTLSPEDIQIVKDVYAANKTLLNDYVNAMLDVLNLPRTSTSVSLSQRMAAGTLPKTVGPVVKVLRILEESKGNYIPLKRFGNYYTAGVYDAAALQAAGNNAVKKKAALTAYIRAENLRDRRKQIADALAADPNAQVEEYEGLDTDKIASSPVSSAELAALAEAAGVPVAAFQNFLDAGVGDYLNTQGVGARFVGSSKLAGFSHDMLRVNASHAKQMTEATQRLRHRAALNELLKKKNLPDPQLREYATRFVERMDTPIPAISGAVRQIVSMYYLGFNAVSAAINASSSMVFAPALAFMSTGNPLSAAQMFGAAAKQQGRALAAIFGNELPRAGRGASMAEQAARDFDKSNPSLATAIRQADKAGVFFDSFEREAEDIARKGEATIGSKIRSGIASAFMHFFSKVETANRLSTFIAGRQMYEKNKNNKNFIKFAEDLGFSGKNASDYGEFFSDFQNFRMDKTDMPSWAQGSYQKGADGNKVFVPSTWRPAAYALKSWSVNYVQQQAVILRAALRNGWISRALYAAIAMGFISMFGALNVIPGMQTVDEVARIFSKDLKSPSEQIAESGAVGRTFATGGAGALADMYDWRAGKIVDTLSSRTGPGNVIPSTLDSLIAPIGVMHALGSAATDIASGDPEREFRGKAALISKSTGKLADAYNIATGTRGLTSKTGGTIVPKEGLEYEGAPAMDWLDIAMYGVGLTPPVVSGSYRMKKLADDMKTSNDKEATRLVDALVDAHMSKDWAEYNKAKEDLRSWNKKAIDEDRIHDFITPEGLEQAVILEYRARKLGVLDPRNVPGTGRKEYYKELEKTLPKE